MGYSGAGGKLIHEKNQKQKISWHCPFKEHPRFGYRQIMMEGLLQMSESGKPVEMFVILFDDMLLISRRKKALSKKVKFSIY